METSLNRQVQNTIRFNRVIVWYFSGTGNSRNAARWVQEYCISQGFACEVHQIGTPAEIEPTCFPPDALLVLISPIHGFNFPHIMLRFLSNLPHGTNQVVLMNTRAGMLIRRWVTPGLTGIAFYLTSVMLIAKGYTIHGMFPIDMPSNWISLHPGLNDRTVIYIHERMKQKLTLYWQSILKGRRGIKNYPAMKEVIQDLLISPIAILYYLIGRFFLAKTFYATDACDHCGICIRNCPVHAISERGGRPFWSFTCESCMRCMGNCPRNAIECAHGFALSVALFGNLIIAYPLHEVFQILLTNAGSAVTGWVVEPIIFLILIAFGYRVFHWGLRFRWFHSMVTRTSLTVYRFWGKKYRALRNI